MTFYRARRAFAESTEVAPINWRRGFFRVWLLVSAAWIMGWAIYLLLHAVQGEFTSFVDLITVLIVLFGSPVALFLFGLASAWAFRGFVVDPEPEPADEP